MSLSKLNSFCRNAFSQILASVLLIQRIGLINSKAESVLILNIQSTLKHGNKMYIDWLDHVAGMILSE